MLVNIGTPNVWLEIMVQPNRLSHIHALLVNLPDFHGLNLVTFSKQIIGNSIFMTIIISSQKLGVPILMQHNAFRGLICLLMTMKLTKTYMYVVWL